MPVRELKANISFVSDYESYRDFLHYLQSNKLPERLELSKKNINIKDEKSFLKFDLASYEYIKLIGLPLSNIRKLNIRKNESGKKDNLINVKMELVFFSRL
jgi:hypothetical protein